MIWDWDSFESTKKKPVVTFIKSGQWQKKQRNKNTEIIVKTDKE